MFTGQLNSSTEFDIKVINAYKRYGQNPIISGLNTNAVSGSIGGQRRRVSLAVSLLHDPKIIIADEPMVGIDSVLRQKKLTEQLNKTVLITTHYIEESNQANSIGFMRNGSVIEEGSPQDILTKYESESLDMAFVRLCYKQEEQNDEAEDYKSVNGSFMKNPKYVAFIYFPTNYTSKFVNFIDQRKGYDSHSQVYIQITKHSK
ncbi:ABC transporter-like,P-loop containing nucleoside triphosphate hydrolase [Cinara cedri]|uniref:ABC transporter-like,P-loop containing nucleoside triphosphate hydrolase n=1 Tax=Cinara cedri TaxID=506608 RepID=A0A5E4NJD7_9HEMI|nr:ABC transporter-like,P-loop containing nucleoside triphosphate hydrolase [Cinara cedri]